MNWDSISFGVDDEPIKRIMMAEPLKGSKAGELTVNFDLVVGVTPEDPKEDPARFRNPKYKKD